jgi:serine/threonine-protein kinase HipA
MVCDTLVRNDEDHLCNHAGLWGSRQAGWRLCPLAMRGPAPHATERFLRLDVGPWGDWPYSTLP